MRPWCRIVLAFACVSFSGTARSQEVPEPEAPQEDATTEEAPTEEAPAEPAEPADELPAATEPSSSEGNDQGNVPDGFEQRAIGDVEEQPADAHKLTRRERRVEARKKRIAKQKAAGPVGLRKATEIVDLYGWFKSHLGFTGRTEAEKGTVDVQDNSSRFGIRAAYSIPSFATIYGRAEWAVAFGSSTSGFNLDANVASEEITGIDNSSPFSTRLGIIGIDLGVGGDLAFGKQWGVYYDVAGFTDHFFVFGGEGNAVFNAGTDGGVFGTGRASNALSYHYRLYGLTVGAQVQFFGEREHTFDTWGLSLRWEGANGLRIGGAFNRASWDDSFGDGVQNSDEGDNPTAGVVGLTYERGGFYFAITASHTVKHAAANFDGPTPEEPIKVAYDTWGGELKVSYLYKNIVGGHVGYQMVIPKNTIAPIDDRFQTQAMILGLTYKWTPFAYSYIEARHNFGYTTSGLRQPFALAIGLGIRFSSRRALEASFAKTDARLVALEQAERDRGASGGGEDEGVATP